jgi:DNA-nicking Smr family endonuclease
VVDQPSKRHKAVDGQKFVTEAVLKLRKESDGNYRKVVQCAKESQEAYKQGDKRKAHSLSEEKKKWQTKQDDANSRAAQLILKAQASNTSGEIDLHGLYLEEALDATKEFLKFWSHKTTTRETVVIITGACHHSENHRAVIRPKVEEIFRKQHLRYESIHGDGAFRVYLRPIQ